VKPTPVNRLTPPENLYSRREDRQSMSKKVLLLVVLVIAVAITYKMVISGD
jgi:hypothetical protein